LAILLLYQRLLFLLEWVLELARPGLVLVLAQVLAKPESVLAWALVLANQQLLVQEGNTTPRTEQSISCCLFGRTAGSHQQG